MSWTILCLVQDIRSYISCVSCVQWRENHQPSVHKWFTAQPWLAPRSWHQADIKQILPSIKQMRGFFYGKFSALVHRLPPNSYHVPIFRIVGEKVNIINSARKINKTQ